MSRKNINRPSYLNNKINDYKYVRRFIYKDKPKPKIQEVFINKFIFNFCSIFGISYIIVKYKL